MTVKELISHLRPVCCKLFWWHVSVLRAEQQILTKNNCTSQTSRALRALTCKCQQEVLAHLVCVPKRFSSFQLYFVVTWLLAYVQLCFFASSRENIAQFRI